MIRNGFRGLGKQTQKGFYVLTVALLLGAVSLMVLSFTALAVRKAMASAEDQTMALLGDALVDVELWYKRNADDIAKRGYGASEEEIKAGLTRPYPGLRFAMSDSMATTACSSNITMLTCIPWRKIAVWSPASTPVNNTTVVKGIPVGQFTSDAKWLIYSSEEWYFGRVSRSADQMNRIGQSLMYWFMNQKAMDPSALHDTNFYRKSNCAEVSPSLPCYDSFTPLTSTEVPSALGLDASELVTPIGSQIEFTNLGDGSTDQSFTEYPYAAALRVRMPWGQTIKMVVTQ